MLGTRGGTSGAGGGRAEKTIDPGFVKNNARHKIKKEELGFGKTPKPVAIIARCFGSKRFRPSNILFF